MIVFYVVVFVVMWLLCGILAMGVTIGYFQNEYPLSAAGNYDGDLRLGMVYMVFGPIGLFAAFFQSRFAVHGLQYRPGRKVK